MKKTGIKLLVLVMLLGGRTSLVLAEELDSDTDESTAETIFEVSDDTSAETAEETAPVEMDDSYDDSSDEETVNTYAEEQQNTSENEDVTITTKLAENAVEYRDENGTCYSCTDYTDFLNIADGAVLTDGWYVLTNDCWFNKRLTVKGNVNIILSNGSILTCKNGIRNSEGNTLSIWESSTGGGYLETSISNSPFHIDAKGAGIGGDDGENGGTLNVHGGYLKILSGERAAAIGGGKEGTGGTINIYDGYICAKSDEGGAGIGGGWHADGGETNIYGGTVVSEAGICGKGLETGVGAGIGGGDGGNGGRITIRGGKVTAYGNWVQAAQGQDAGHSAGIGGGDEGGAGTILITGGNVCAYATHSKRDYRESEGPGIGSGEAGEGGSVTITGGVIHAGGYVAVGSGHQGSGVIISLGDNVRVDGYNISDCFDGLKKHDAVIYTV